MLTDYKDSGLKKIKIVQEKHYKLMCCCMIKKGLKFFISLFISRRFMLDEKLPSNASQICHIIYLYSG